MMGRDVPRVAPLGRVHFPQRAPCSTCSPTRTTYFDLAHIVYQSNRRDHAHTMVQCLQFRTNGTEVLPELGAEPCGCTPLPKSKWLPPWFEFLPPLGLRQLLKLHVPARRIPLAIQVTFSWKFGLDNSCPVGWLSRLERSGGVPAASHQWKYPSPLFGWSLGSCVTWATGESTPGQEYKVTFGIRIRSSSFNHMIV
jgi:hypothetical protein